MLSSLPAGGANRETPSRCRITDSNFARGDEDANEDWVRRDGVYVLTALAECQWINRAGLPRIRGRRPCSRSCGASRGRRAGRAARRGLEVCDALPAVLVVDAVLRSRPLRARLAVGVVSALPARPQAPQPGNAAMLAASLTGATIATSLLPHVDA